MSTGAGASLAGSPAIAVYKDNGTTESTAGASITADFDSVTGLVHLTIDTSADATFYSPGSIFAVVVTAGTIGGTSAVGKVLYEFELSNVGTSARTIINGTVGAGSSTTSVVTSAIGVAPAVADQFKGRLAIFAADTTTAALRGQVCEITASSNASLPVLTVTDLTTAPSSGDRFVIV